MKPLTISQGPRGLLASIIGATALTMIAQGAGASQLAGSNIGAVGTSSPSGRSTVTSVPNPKATPRSAASGPAKAASGAKTR